VERGKITAEELHPFLEMQRTEAERLGRLLVRHQRVAEREILECLCLQWGMGPVDLKTTIPESKALTTVPEGLARRYRALPLSRDGKRIVVAMEDPYDFDAVRDITFASGREVIPVPALRSDLSAAMDRYYGIQESCHYEEGLSLIQEQPPAVSEYALSPQSQAPLIIRLSDLILRKGVKAGASDIHIEPDPERLTVRFRIDGILMEGMQFPLWIHLELISRFKVLARMDIAEKRLPQDGTFRLRIDDREIDLRISTLPTRYGEKGVLRILDTSYRPVALEDLGFSPEDHDRVEGLIRRRKGILLVTGPTGSGKTTTLYAMIQKIRSKEINIVTVEDPVEYNMAGVNQVQVRSEIGLGFARCLRSILRQDPDVILLGEIRDRETAEMAFAAAMTGHLVLTTLHTNDAVSTLLRLYDLGISRYVAASTVIGIIAQRLVRRLCRSCLGKGEGCVACRDLKFSGRAGLYEILIPDEGVRDLIASGAWEKALRQGAAGAGMRTLWEDGLGKIAAGWTTTEEVRRVVDE
jgi:type IV pilus assembly protein PilB